MENEFTESYIKSLYNAKAKQSFKTKLNIFLFEKVLNDLKGDIDPDSFKKYEIKNEVVNIYTTEYWQYEEKYVLGSKGKTIKEIYNEIKDLNTKIESITKQMEIDYVSNTFPSLFPIEKFRELLGSKTEEERKCHYCDITKTRLIELANKQQLFKKNLRGWSLEIDRKNSNFEYTFDNCVLACYWCNNAKTDEFTEKEFKVIGQAIKEIWETRKAKYDSL